MSAQHTPTPVAELVAAGEELRGVSMVFGQSKANKIARANARYDAALAAFRQGAADVIS